MEQNSRELKIRKVNERQFDVVLKEPGSVTIKHGLTYEEVKDFLWAVYGRMMYNCDSGRSMCGAISVKF